jgi:hypothetical protein
MPDRINPAVRWASEDKGTMIGDELDPGCAAGGAHFGDITSFLEQSYSCKQA